MKRNLFRIDTVGRVTIPKAMRDKLGLDIGVRVDMQLENDTIIIKRKKEEVKGYVLEMSSNTVEEIKVVKFTDSIEEVIEAFLNEYTDCLMKGFNLDNVKNIEEAKIILPFGEQIILKNNNVLVGYRVRETTIMK